MKIIPALLTHTQKEIHSQLERLLPHYSHFHIDIADGKFVPNTTLQIEEIGEVLKHYTQPIECDFHLMVQDYEQELTKIRLLTEYIQVNTVFVHYDVISLEQFINRPVERFAMGIVINPANTITHLTKGQLLTVPAIQIMTIQPGFQGQPFMPEMLTKIDELRAVGYKNDIYLDGSMNDQTIPIITTRQKKPNYINVGSYLTHADNIEERIDLIESFLKKAS